MKIRFISIQCGDRHHLFEQQQLQYLSYFVFGKQLTRGNEIPNSFRSIMISKLSIAMTPYLWKMSSLALLLDMPFSALPQIMEDFREILKTCFYFSSTQFIFRIQLFRGGSVLANITLILVVKQWKVKKSLPNYKVSWIFHSVSLSFWNAVVGPNIVFWNYSISTYQKSNFRVIIIFVTLA